MLEVDVLQSPLNNDSSSETLDKFGKSFENSEIKKKNLKWKNANFLFVYQFVCFLVIIYKITQFYLQEFLLLNKLI